MLLHFHLQNLNWYKRRYSCALQTLVLRIADTYHSVAAVEVVEHEGVVRAVVKDRVSVVLVLDLHQEETRSRELRAPVVFNLKHTSARV